ncbi:hypothetical protein CYMTET_28613 [Cymbomonas tetramitiformis]|uniref:Uncharacterized protein n=1 Tax=Cymbomonas tetramitiformis TaxID=36881 RepID=A0AAE0KW02_9CHLO|nr:hypothetical protein CYMTET_28613 [Cymbomonas tetramitiformis]
MWMEAVLRTLGDAGIRLHSGKSTFGSSTVDFLGFQIEHNSIGVEEVTCKAIQELPKPEDKTGLEMLLRSGVKVNSYPYQDISLSSQAVARAARCMALSRRYPDMLPARPIKLDQLPPDLGETTPRDLIDAGALSAGEK